MTLEIMTFYAHVVHDITKDLGQLGLPTSYSAYPVAKSCEVTANLKTNKESKHHLARAKRFDARKKRNK